MREMSLETVDAVCRRYGKTSRIDWYNWGEPLLHSDFVGVSETVKGTDSVISTSLSLELSDAYIGALRRFRRVWVSISGMTKEIYAIYHRGGSFSLVMDNLRRLVVSSRRRIGVRWLQHRYNTHQMSNCIEICKDAGIRFESFELGCTIEDRIDGFDHGLMIQKRVPKSDPSCRILNWPTVSVNGEYTLCCATRNVGTGLYVHDGVSPEELLRVRSGLPLCVTCRDRELWRMF